MKWIGYVITGIKYVGKVRKVAQLATIIADTASFLENKLRDEGLIGGEKVKEVKEVKDASN